MIDIPTPAEIAEANRVKDEAADDALLEEFLARVIERLKDYRGSWIIFGMPGPHDKPTTVRSPLRFESAVKRHFEGTGWHCELNHILYGRNEGIIFDSVEGRKHWEPWVTDSPKGIGEL
jgi:hypothetical protein